jgi:dUTP pyrophosphatase
MQKIAVKIINKSDNPAPEYATDGAAGFDLRAFLTEQVELLPLQRKLIPTGLFMEIPNGYEGQVRPRSGLALKQGLTCLNAPGTIDSDYRGEVGVILINLSQEPQIIRTGERIAQLVIAKSERAELVSVEAINETMRGSGGFGHTGKN